ncbi:Exodeoxyribonuclease 7 large subunit [Paraliobacillus sp. PM-2]|uniref:exodeoxyribonuclease VII large subunit n=1 Tax=Paraliobacillus sp. PM-2 TaxID=1462524 RepID=UPI00061BD521|nr:exodeoxyribonuclease VII large subunit [Paraliobacillus sp. PM-2]CQR46784.1 Exodeoxyribonuclease 7 large subunit [Paraliobacillus sp. PM-2]
MQDNYLTVTALTRYIKRKFELDKHLKEVWLKGEISNFKHHSRGHMYLTIKDDHSRVNAVMFAGNNRSLKFMPENGMQVLIKGQVSVYEPQGQYQLYIQEMEPDGIGALHVAFEQLKEKLHNEGLFDPSLKKSLPPYPQHIGIVTSPTGAAVRDILITIKRRYPIAAITIFPALVQGEHAPSSIVAAIKQANVCDVPLELLIVGRGGGSIEELWGFNDERVARAIVHSNLPVISGVGHETDITIADFVADVRAATPTGAAELAVPSKEDVDQKITNLTQAINRSLAYRIEEFGNKLERLQKSYAFRYPAQLINQKEQELDKLIDKLSKTSLDIVKNKQNQFAQNFLRLRNQHPNKQLEINQKDVTQLLKRHKRAMDGLLTHYKQDFISKVDKLNLLSPLHTMKRGYSIAYTEQGSVIQSNSDVQVGDNIAVKLQDGMIDCHVYGIEEDEKNDG